MQQNFPYFLGASVWRISRYSLGVFVLLLLTTYYLLSTANAATTDQFTVGVSVVSDVTAPSIPAGLTATAISSSQINLSWTASTDDVAVSGYVVRRNLVIVATSSGTTYSDTGLVANTTYNYTVAAFDGAFNYSAISATSSATTLAAGGGPVDSTPPSVSALSPLNNATGVSSTTALVMMMSESVSKFSGNILVKKVSDASIAQTIGVSGSQVSVSGSVVTIALASPLSSNTAYYVEVPAGAFADTAGNAFAGFSGAGTWSFTTADTVPPVITGIAATSTYTSGTITFTTDKAAEATLEWGTTTSYGDGAMSEVGYVTNHSMTISGLATGTTYYYRLSAKDAANNISIPSTGLFATLTAPPAPDTTPPANPSNFTGTPGETTVALSWINPTDLDFAAVRVMRKTSGYPGTPTDGVLVYDGPSTSYIDTGLTPGTQYYYTIFARDNSGNYSSGAIVSVTTTTTIPPPPPPPSPTPTPTPTPGGATPPPGGPPSPTPTPSSSPVIIEIPPFTSTTTGPFTPENPNGIPNPRIAGLTLNDVIFTQLGKAGESDERLAVKNGVVRVNSKRNLRVAIPYDALPEVLKTIAISITDPVSGKDSSYILRVNAGKTFYEAVIQNFGKEGDFPFTISILDHDRGTVTRLSGVFHSFNPTQLPSFVPPGIAQAVTGVIDSVREPIEAATPVAGSVGVAVGVSQAVLLTTNVSSFYDLYLLLLKLIGLLTGLFRRKKNEPWGVVYDSVTKRPLDPAYVIAQVRASQQSKGEAITDLDGRYGFLLNPGEYLITANKTHYKFPSEKLKGRARDEFYENLYFGDPFQVREGGVVQYNIPLDPLEFDWNEFAKNQDKVFQVYSQRERIQLWVFNIIFYIGLSFSTFSLLVTPSLINGLVVLVYAVILSFQVFWRVTHKVTRVINKLTGRPVPFALIKVWYPGINTVVKKVVADEHGRFYFLVPPGTYYLTVEGKQPDGSYKEILRTTPRELTRGVVKDDFIV